MINTSNSRYIDGEKLSAALVRRGMTPSDLALKTGVGVGTVTSTWMRTAGVPEYKVRLICAALGMEEDDLFISKKAAREAGQERMTPATRAIASLAELHGDSLELLIRSVSSASADDLLVRGRRPTIKLVDFVAKKYGVDAKDIITGKIDSLGKGKNKAAVSPDGHAINIDGLALINLAELKAEITAVVRQEAQTELIAQVRNECVKQFQNSLLSFIKAVSENIKQCEKDESAYMEIGDKKRESAASLQRQELSKQIQTIKAFAALAKINLAGEGNPHE